MSKETYESIIGLEIHVQLKTKSKMFCGSPNNPDVDEPNVNICEVCSGQPGSLPVANKEAIRKAIMVGLALNCEIPEYSKFDRKNYFYPDLPKGYQISQYDQPLAKGGWVEAGSRRIRIIRAHLEEDAGKLIHPSTGSGQASYSLVDLNRAGVPLLEIVTEPDFRSPQEAKLFLQNLRNIVRYLGVSDADMEKGHLRCDANVSVRKLRVNELPSYKVEVKNLNSFKAVESALVYEIDRQTAALERGQKLVNETRGWDEGKQITIAQRTKEEAHDYRYFPEPDLPIMHFTKEFVEGIRRELSELPGQKLERFMSEYGLSRADGEVLINDKDLAGYFEAAVSELQEWFEAEKLSADNIQRFAKLASNWITGDFQALLKTANIAPQDSRITPENLAELIKMIDRGEISVTAGKQVLAIMFEKGGDPSSIVQDEGLAQVSDQTAIEQAIDKVMMENQKAVEDYRAGKSQSFGFLVGQIMKELKGKGNPQLINELLRKRLS